MMGGREGGGDSSSTQKIGTRMVATSPFSSQFLPYFFPSCCGICGLDVLEREREGRGS